MSRKPLVVGNWKLHHTQAATRSWCHAYRKLSEEGKAPASGSVDLGIAPPFTSIGALAAELGGSGLLVGGQNLHWETSGAFTGEVSGEMLAEAGCRFVIVGHSERRHIFGEADARIARKLSAARQAGLTPILCVGETEEERDSGRMEVVIETQLQRALDQWRPTAPEELILAYEPVWAIGTGRTATPDQAQQAHHFLREILAGATGPRIATGTRVLYGGSVKPGNAGELASKADIDGFLVGGASLEAASFLAIAGAGAR